jgi:hypothetical protein
LKSQLKYGDQLKKALESSRNFLSGGTRSSEQVSLALTQGKDVPARVSRRLSVAE